MKTETAQHTPTPWSLGTLLDTPQTRRWSAIERVAGEREEEIRVFANFHISDEGRSRQLVAICRDPENAAFIVRAVNAHESLLRAAKLLIQLDDECRANPKKLNGLLEETRRDYLNVIAKAEGE
jgi:hypothetical protein